MESMCSADNSRWKQREGKGNVSICGWIGKKDVSIKRMKKFEADSRMKRVSVGSEEGRDYIKIAENIKRRWLDAKKDRICGKRISEVMYESQGSKQSYRELLHFCWGFKKSFIERKEKWKYASDPRMWAVILNIARFLLRVWKESRGEKRNVKTYIRSQLLNSHN